MSDISATLVVALFLVAYLTAGIGIARFARWASPSGAPPAIWTAFCWPVLFLILGVGCIMFAIEWLAGEERF